MSARDVILVSHPVHVDISEDEMRAALPASDVVRGVVEIKPARLTLEETRGADWLALARRQDATWRAEVLPLLERYVGATVVYFGVAPIPLAVHLGSLVERLNKVTAYLRHHQTHKWTFAGGARPKITGPAGPQELTRSTEPATISISTTASTDTDALREVVGATSADMGVLAAPFGEDVLTAEDLVHEVARKFHDCLDLLETNRPGVTEAHLAAAVPTGLAFLLGTQLTSTRHVRLVTYQYHRSEDPRFVEALRLPVRDQPRRVPTAEDIARAATLRAAWEQERQLLANHFSPAADRTWWNVLGDIGREFQVGSFALLQHPAETPLAAPIDTTVTEVDTDFRFDSERERWLLGDGLLASISSAVPTEEVNRAGRMLLLHEALHHGSQGLTEAKAPQIRHAPKVLEELDYLADTWAMMHEFAFSRLLDADWNAQRKELLRILETAVSTMWAFDADREPGVLEVRRVNRYLIWYAQFARLESATTLLDAVRSIAIKPVIELIGPHTELRDGRLVMLLDRTFPRPAELCFLNRHGKLRRVGSTNAASVAAIAHALGAHDGDTVRKLARGFLDGED